MSASCTRRDTCRLCGGRRLEEAFCLAPTAVADAFVPASRLRDEQPVYPLDLVVCGGCGHLQLLHTVDPRLLFGNYIYVSSSSPGLVEHFRGAADRLVALIRPETNALAVDIGSNDGTLLRFLKARGMRVVGVDPAPEIARRAAETGVPTVADFFTSALARSLRAEHGPAALVTANNVFAHSDALADMADGVRELLAPSGLFVFEVAYLTDMLRNMVFDSIYHEHLSYHSVKPLVSFFQRHGLELVHAEHVQTKGGSLRIAVQLAGGTRPMDPNVERLLAEESSLGLDRPQVFKDYASTIERSREAILHAMAAYSRKASLAGYGASPTVTTLLYHFGLADRIGFLVDDNPIKQGLFSPGHHIPVLPSKALYDKKPDAVVILAWRFAEPILKRHQAYLAQGGRMIVPLPELRVIEGTAAS